MNPTSKKTNLTVARGIAHVLDDMHLDPIIGLVLPMAGDVLSGIAGLGIIGLAAQSKVPKATLARMLLNLAVDVGVGALPLVGDAFDFWFKANKRNVALFESATAAKRARWQDILILIAAGLALLVAMMLPLVGAFFLGQYLLTQLR